MYSRFDISASGIGLTYTLVTSTWTGQIDMWCAHAQWVANGYCRFI